MSYGGRRGGRGRGGHNNWDNNVYSNGFNDAQNGRNNNFNNEYRHNMANDNMNNFNDNRNRGNDWRRGDWRNSDRGGGFRGRGRGRGGTSGGGANFASDPFFQSENHDRRVDFNVHRIDEQNDSEKGFTKFRDPQVNQNDTYNSPKQLKDTNREKFIKLKKKKKEKSPNIAQDETAVITPPSGESETIPNHSHERAKRKGKQSTEKLEIVLKPKMVNTSKPPTSEIGNENSEKVRSSIAELIKKERAEELKNNSTNDDNTENSTVLLRQVKNNTKNLDAKKRNKKSSYSSDSEADEEEKHSKTGKKLNIKDKDTSEDVVCLGKLERKFIISENEYAGETDSDNNDEELKTHVSQEIKSKNKKNDGIEQCMICDEMNHTSFQCLMVCKNCAAPHHNLKTCPHPANANIVMQSFMEFCMLQLNNFSPEKSFQLPVNVFTINPPTTINSTLTPSLNSSRKRRKRQKTKTKKSSKKKRKEVNSDDDADTDATLETSSSDTSSSGSEEVSSDQKPKSSKSKKRKRNHSISSNKIQKFANMPPTATPISQFNPLLYSQMMQNSFPWAVNSNL